jgi:hypothetical protein
MKSEVVKSEVLKSEVLKAGIMKTEVIKSEVTKSFIICAAKIAAACLIAALAIVAARAQAAPTFNGRLRLDSLERLAPKAAETVNIDVDGILIQITKGILSDDDPDEKSVKEIIEGLKGVYVRSYEFKTEGQFTEADLAQVREQLRAPVWTRVVDVKSHGVDIDNAEIYLATAGDKVEGLVLLDVEPKELTIINIVGSIDIEKLKKLEGSLGIPRIHVGRKGAGKRRRGQ